MPQSDKLQAQFPDSDIILRAFSDIFEKAFATAIKQQGFTDTLKGLKKGRLRAPEMMTVEGGVAEKLPSGKYDAALQTDRGPLLLRGAERTDRESTDLQLSPTNTDQTFEAITQPSDFTADQLVRQLADSISDAPSSLLCLIELTRFDPPHCQILLPLLWQYILDHRNSNDRDILVGVAAAIRKYIAIIPMDQMGKLAALLDTGHKSPLPIDLEIEVAKMVYRNFEVYPPVVEDPQPELAQRFWEMVQAYINPRILLRDKHSAVTSLAIEAIVSMRSPLAEHAWRAAIACPYGWFSELINDELDELYERWESKNQDAAAWLHELRSNVLAPI
jgi:hypothetical protein